MKKVAVVIPSYMEKLSRNEEISLAQCRSILSRYDRYLIIPDTVNVEYAVDEKLIRTKAKNLSSRKKYSDYVLTEEFYSLFLDYEYILIYQPDAFVFEDRLVEFCDLGYDYIGAEWVYGLECYYEGDYLWYFGNGGFSLRNVKAFLKWIRECREEIDYAKMILNEDMVISMFGRERLKIAESDVSRDFSFDMYPEKCYKDRKGRLPFGCHAWHRFDKGFWKSIIDLYGYEVEIDNSVDPEAVLLSTGEERVQRLKKYFDINKIDPCLRKLIRSYNGRLYVFGAGQYGFSFINMVKSLDIVIEGVIDNSEEKKGKYIEGIPIIGLCEAVAHREIPILIVLSKPINVEKQLQDSGYEKNKDYALSGDLQKMMCEE